MSEIDNKKTLSVEDISSRTKVYSVVPGTSLEKLPKASDSQSIVINVYPSTYFSKTDKVIQTEVAESEEEKESESVKEIKTEEVFARREKKEVATETTSEHEVVKIHEKIRSLPLLGKKLSRHMSSQEKKEEKSSEHRKSATNDKTKNSIPTNRTQSDLERKKLEAELKAAEEIARLKQIVIEKRLAVELASIQNNVDSDQKPTFSTASYQNEFRKLDELALRKQSMIETNLAQELETLDYQNRILQQQQQIQQQLQQQQQQQQRLLPPPPPPMRVPSPTLLRAGYKAESSSSVINSIKNLNLLDKKINLDKRLSNDLGTRKTSPTNLFTCNEVRYTDPRLNKKDYGPYISPSAREPNYAKVEDQGKSPFNWKSTFSKFKKKIKPNSTRWTGQ